MHRSGLLKVDIRMTKNPIAESNSRTGIATLEISECTVCPCEANGPPSMLKLSYQSPIFRRARVGLLGISGEVCKFEDNTISRFPEGMLLDSPYDSNFQPCRAFRLLIRELLYNLQRGKLNIRWLERRLGYLFLGGGNIVIDTYSPLGCKQKSD